MKLGMKWLFLIPVLLLMALTLLAPGCASSQQEDNIQPQPDVVEERPTPQEKDNEEEIILRLFSQEYGIPVEHLQLTNGKGNPFGTDPITGLDLQWFSACDTSVPDHPCYDLIIDSEYNARKPAEYNTKAFKEKYGKVLSHWVYGSLFGSYSPNMLLTDKLEVVIWLKAGSNRLAIIQFIESRGFQVTSPSKIAPTLFATIPKNLILEITQLPEVDFIYMWTTYEEMEPVMGKRETVLEGTDLVFETIEKKSGPKFVRESAKPEDFAKVQQLEVYMERRPQVYVVASNQDPLLTANKWVSIYAQADMTTIDYSRYFVFIAFHGYGSIATDIEIKRICQKGDTVYAVAHFTAPPKGAPVPAASASWYHVVKVSKEKMTQVNESTFELLDQSGEVRATTTRKIP